MLIFYIILGLAYLLSLIYTVKSREGIEDLEVDFYKRQNAIKNHSDKLNRLGDSEKTKIKRENTQVKLDQEMRKMDNIFKSLKRKTLLRRVVMVLQILFFGFAIIAINVS